MESDETLTDESRSEDGTTTEEEMDDEGNLRGFVVPDNLLEDEGPGFGLSDQRLEDDWESWKPLTKSEEMFKRIVDKYAKKSKGSSSKTIPQA